MLSPQSRRARIILAAGVVGGGVLVAGGAAFAIDPPNTYTGCLFNGSITNVAIGTQPKIACLSKATKISWNQQGVPGSNGINGADGAPGTNGTNGVKGDPGLKGDPGNNGTNGVSGYLVQTSQQSGSAAPGATVTAIPRCPVGKKILSAGYEFTDGAQAFRASQSYPLVAVDGAWVLALTNDSSSAATYALNLYAVCADA